MTGSGFHPCNSVVKLIGLGLGIGVAIALLAFLTLVPFSVEQTIGYEVAFAGVDERLALDEERFSQFLVTLGIEDADYSVSDCDKVCNVTVKGIPSADQARLLVAAFDQMDNVILLKGISEEHGDVHRSVVELIGNEILVGSHVSLTDNEIHQLLLERVGDSLTCNLIFYSRDDLDSNHHAIFITEQGDTVNVINQDGGWVADSSASHFIVLRTDGDSLEHFVWHSNAEGNGAVGSYQIHEIFKEVGVDPGDIAGTLDEEKRQALAERGIEIDVVESEDGKVEIKLRMIHTEGSGENQDRVDTENQSPGKSAEAILPEGYSLEQNYPNPFNPTTTIEYEIGATQNVTLEIINVQGQVVRTLVDQPQSAGVHSVQWDATNDAGERVASGTYFYRLSAGDFSQTKQMVLVK
jgi:hypothetical protein